MRCSLLLPARNRNKSDPILCLLLLAAKNLPSVRTPLPLRTRPFSKKRPVSVATEAFEVPSAAAYVHDSLPPASRL